jgi:hypothetical protein
MYFNSPLLLLGPLWTSETMAGNVVCELDLLFLMILCGRVAQAESRMILVTPEGREEGGRHM